MTNDTLPAPRSRRILSRLLPPRPSGRRLFRRRQRSELGHVDHNLPPHRSADLSHHSHLRRHSSTVNARAHRLPTPPSASSLTPTRSHSTISTQSSRANVHNQHSLFCAPPEHYHALDHTGKEVAEALLQISNSPQLFDVSVVPLLVRSLQDHHADPLVCDRALNLLRSYTVSPETRREVGNVNGIDAIVAVMLAHNLRLRLVSQACLVLANLSYHDEENKKAVLKTAMPPIVAAMALHTTSPHTQAWGALAIRNASNTEHNQDACSAIEVLVAALERYSTVPTVASNALAALTNIACTQEAVRQIADAGCPALLMQMLNNNMHDEKLTHLILSLQLSLVESPEVSQQFGEAGGIISIANILQIYQDNSAMHILVAAMLRVLAFTPHNRTRFAPDNILPPLLTVLQTAADDAQPHRLVMLLKGLANVIFDSAALKATCVRQQVIPLLLTLLRDRDSEAMAEACLRVLRNLTDQCPEAGKAVLSSGGVGLIVANVQTVWSDGGGAGVAEHAVACLVNLAPVGGLGGVGGALVDIQQRYGGNKRVDMQLRKLKALVSATG